jgi:hypothetical protein
MTPAAREGDSPRDHRARMSGRSLVARERRSVQTTLGLALSENESSVRSCETLPAFPTTIVAERAWSAPVSRAGQPGGLGGLNLKSDLARSRASVRHQAFRGSTGIVIPRWDRIQLFFNAPPVEPSRRSATITIARESDLPEGDPEACRRPIMIDVPLSRQSTRDWSLSSLGLGRVRTSPFRQLHSPAPIVTSAR